MKEYAEPERVPQVLYKYLSWEHAHAMLATGSLRIGTLHEYRMIEQHGPVVGDQHEGLVSAVDYVNRKRRGSRSTLNPPLRVTLDVPGDNRLTDISIYATQDYIQFFEEWPDTYVYCLSKVLDPKVMRAFNADAAIQIHRPMDFFLALTRHLRRKLKITAYFFGSCGYQERIGSLQDTPRPALFIKDPGYAYQQEVRLAWLPDRLPISPVVTRCKALTQFVSLVDCRAIGESRDSGT